MHATPTARDRRHDSVRANRRWNADELAPCLRAVTTVDAATAITIPADLLPADGRFGCGPSKVRDEQVQALVAGARHDPRHLAPQASREEPRRRGPGEAHRAVRAPRRLGDRARQRWLDRVLGRRHVRSRRRERSQHLVFGEFSSKFAEACAAAPHLGDPTIIKTEPGTHRIGRRRGRDRRLRADPQRDVHRRVDDARTPGRDVGDDALVVVDATSAAGGIVWDPAEVDVYYFAPQKCFASDGGLWIAACSPAAVERIGAIGCERPLAAGLARPRDRPRQLDAEPDLQHAGPRHVGHARRPARLDARQRRAAVGGGTQRHLRRHALRVGRGARLGDAVRRRSGTPLERRRHDRSRRPHRRQPGVRHPAGERRRSTPTAYRKLGRNQLRIGMFPAIDPSDVEALTHCIDHVVEQLG